MSDNDHTQAAARQGSAATSGVEARGVATIRGLCMDMPEAAKSGHPGTGMALAPLAHVLWTRVMRYDATDPEWFDRDRFVLSCGHASALLYSMLHLTGFGLELDDLRQFRQWGSKTPGHPELGHTAGVEVTTGPLGQGIANAVGMALAEAHLRARFGASACSHYTYCIVSDGDLMEGISHEAASLAGHLGLGRLVVIYDDNHITIDGATDLAYSDDAGARFRAYGWDVDEVGEIANDLDALEAALERAKAAADRPTLIRLRSHIGFPSPGKTDTSSAHGEPLGADEISRTKAILGLPDTPFHVDDEVRAMYRSAGSAHRADVAAWQERVASLDDDRRAEFELCLDTVTAPGWESALPRYDAGTQVATRAASGEVLNALTAKVPGLIGGGADLTGNTGTMAKGIGVHSRTTPEGRLVHYGIREHAMGAVMTGMAAHGGLLPFGGTFFVFSDYMRGAIRVASISGVRVIYSFTHDSIGVGEDGPTHQPVEQLASLRAMPDLRVVRPADANEVSAAWKVAVTSDGPTALILSRQKVPVLPNTVALAVDGVRRGAYVLSPAQSEEPDVVLVGTGSEVQLCMSAAATLRDDGTDVQVVSMPSWDLFEEQGDAYIDAVFPPGVPVVACEMGSSFGWERWADLVIGIDTWGASAPAERVIAEYGFTAEAVVEAARLLLDEDPYD